MSNAVNKSLRAPVSSFLCFAIRETMLVTGLQGMHQVLHRVRASVSLIKVISTRVRSAVDMRRAYTYGKSKFHAISTRSFTRVKEES